METRKTPVSSETPWHSAFPAPKATVGSVSRSTVLEWLSKKDGPLDYVLVDVRRVDHEGGTISGSLNLPAQSFYASRPTVYKLLKQAGIKKAVFYCGSCNGRGPRAAGWLADYLQERGDNDIQSLILEGGIKGWVKAGGEYVARMDDYDPASWK
ncbi:hypothetical protein McanCB56680_004248 [Microsporum canis]|uniref:Rhodanese domain-containing protein n=1 Tax=Arthroderma otae (strain ATCC MYA-4605 / CBS 113480) TaxID=554155 RepID=C5FSP7_ARTOC|nr:conserved hypothetical protein [Microsporum canis CBS 113480]EEQ32900.1 conserved hypothetical protein [Microsporum canis CBS 113480]